MTETLKKPEASDRGPDMDAGERFGQKATHQIAKLLAASLVRANVSPAEAPTWKMHAQCGSARLVIEKVVKKADTDLLVLGTHGYSGVAHVLLGTVAGDVLREVACDVLVVPGLRRAEELA